MLPFQALAKYFITVRLLLFGTNTIWQHQLGSAIGSLGKTQVKDSLHQISWQPVFCPNITPEATNLATVAVVRFLVAGIGLLEGLEEHVEQNRGRDAETQQDVARQVQGRVVGG